MTNNEGNLLIERYCNCKQYLLTLFKNIVYENCNGLWNQKSTE